MNIDYRKELTQDEIEIYAGELCAYAEANDILFREAARQHREAQAEIDRLKRELAAHKRPARGDMPKVVRDLAAMNDKFTNSNVGKSMALMKAMADRARRDYGDAL